MKLSPKNKKKQMNEKYKYNAYEMFKRNFNSKVDLQGWRNGLIKKLPKFNKLVSADFGCGLGDKTAVLLDSYKKEFKKAYLIDFSSSATKNVKKFFVDKKNIIVINNDATLALKEIEDNSINVALMFGFLHEIADREKFLRALKYKLAKDFIILVSDNELYYRSSELHKDFLDLGFKGNCFKRIFDIFNLKLFISIKKNFKLKNIAIRFIKGRSDSFFAYYTSDNLEKFMQFSSF